jgi:hypothetical protein
LIGKNLLQNLNITKLKIKLKKLKFLGLIGNPWPCANFEAISKSSIDLKIQLKHLPKMKCNNRSIPVEVSELDEYICKLTTDGKFLNLKTKTYLQIFLAFSLFAIDLCLITINFY